MPFKLDLHVRPVRRFVRRAVRVSLILLLLLMTAFVLPQQALAAPGTYTVNRADDIAPRGPGVTCITPASTDCTLREAVIKANANPGSTIQFAASLNGTPIVLTRSGNDAIAAVGDLDINASTDIIGNGAANTIIQGAEDALYTNSIGDKVFGINQSGAFPSLTVNFSGLTIRYGDNAIPSGDPSWAFTGGGVDVYFTGSNNSTTFTDCVLSNNRSQTSYGGGLNVDSSATGTNTLTLTNVTFSNNSTTSTTTTSNGGALNVFGSNVTVNISNSTFQSNSVPSAVSVPPGNRYGGAIYFGPATASLSIDGTTFSGNTAAQGGAVYISSNTVSIEHSRFTGNTATTSGGALSITGGTANLHYNRIVNNTPASSALNVSGGTVDATENWWGCSTGPSAAPCDRTNAAAGVYTPWLRDLLTSSAGTTLVTNQTSTLTASFLTNSSGGAVPVGNLTQLIGQPVTWNNSNGTVGSLSGTQGTIQAGGTATGAFTATAPGSTTLYARVDNDNTAPVSYNVLGLTVNKANTTTAVTSSLNPSMIGQTVTFTASITGAYGNTPTVPGGNVQFFDGATSLGTVAVNASAQATLTTAALTAGSHTITATYLGDANFNTSTSPALIQVVLASPIVTDVTSTHADGTYTVGEVIPITITFNMPVTVTGGPPQLTLETGTTDRVVNYSSGTGTATLTFNYTVQAGDTSPDLDYAATTSLALNGGTIRDAATNTNDAILTLPSPGGAGSLGGNKAIVIDTTSPTVTNVSSPHANGTFTIGEVIPITVTFSESVIVTGTPQLTLETGATNRVVNYTSGSGTDTLTFTYTVQAGDTSLDLDYVATTSLGLNSGTIRDAATNNADLTLASPGAAGSLGANKAIVIDTTAPTVAMSSAAPNPTNTSPIPVTVQFSEAVAGFVAGDITPTNGTVNNFVAVAGDTYTFDLTPSGQGLVTADVAAGVAVDAAGNGNTAAAQFSRNYDSAAPTVAMSSAAPNPTNTSPIPVTVQFSEPVTGFAAGDITPTNGTVNNFVAVAGDTYTFDLTPSGQGLVTADIAAGVAVDAASNGNTAAAQFSRTYDSAAPTVAMSSAAPNPTNTSPIPVTVQFSEPVAGFVAGDITPTNATVNNFVPVAGDTYTFDLTPSGQGLVTADIAAGVAQDASGNGNTAAAQFSRTYDSIGPNVTIDQAAGQTDPTSASPVNFAVQFTENVADFTSGDVILGGTAGATTINVTGGPANYNVEVSGMTTPGTVVISIAANAAHDATGNGNTASNNVDNTVTFTFNAGTTLVSSNLSAIVGETVTFTATVTSLGGTPTGNVEFREGAVVLGTGALNAGGQATFSTNTLALGTHNITAYYLGAAGYNASHSAPPIAQVIGLANTTTTIATSGTPSGFGAPVTFTATVTVVAPGTGTPTGSVEFFDGATSLGTGALGGGGQATLTTSALATGTHTITARYGGDANFNNSTSPGIIQTVNGPPSVDHVDSDASTIFPAPDNALVENEHAGVAIIRLLVVFSKDMNAADAGTAGNYHLVVDGSPVDLVNSAIYNNLTFTTTLNINVGPLGLPDGRYTLTVLGGLEDTLGAPIGTDFVRHFYVDNGHPHHTSIVTIPNNAAIVNGATINVSFSSVDISFDEDLYDPAGNIDLDDVTNAENYLLVTPGSDGMFQTSSCAAGIAGDDVALPIGPITYTNHGGGGPFVATAQLNGGTALPNGLYRLLICGTTSIVDLAGNPLNGDAGPDSQVDFTVLVLSGARNPKTGFAPGVVTVLPEQPADKAYASLGDLWIEIPNLNLKTGITGVPLTMDGWDLTWLNRQVGWLEGTAYPTWEGNTVLTAHGYTADGEAGPFALLKNLSYGETIVIHLGGMKYTYAVRTNTLTSPNNTYWLTKHEKLDWITLITCQQYDDKTKSYLYRRVVRAVLIKVEAE